MKTGQRENIKVSFVTIESEQIHWRNKNTS